MGGGGSEIKNGGGGVLGNFFQTNSGGRRLYATSDPRHNMYIKKSIQRKYGSLQKKLCIQYTSFLAKLEIIRDMKKD